MKKKYAAIKKFLRKRSSLVLVSCAISAFLILGGIAFALAQTSQPGRHTAADVHPDEKQGSKATPDASTSAAAPLSTRQPEPTAPATPTSSAIPKSSTSTPQQSSGSQSSSTQSQSFETPARYSVSKISNPYTWCQGGVLHYSLGTVDIYTTGKVNPTFSWRLEVSDGTISDSGTDTLPAGQTTWFSFPSTSSYPQMLGNIDNAEDGDRARVVILSPNYAAGPWSNPVPAGSQQACSSGQM